MEDGGKREIIRKFEGIFTLLSERYASVTDDQQRLALIDLNDFDYLTDYTNYTLSCVRDIHKDSKTEMVIATDLARQYISINPRTGERTNLGEYAIIEGYSRVDGFSFWDQYHPFK